MPAVERVYGLHRPGLASMNALERYHGGRKSVPVAAVSCYHHSSSSPSTSLLWLPSAIPEKRLAAEARRRRSWGRGLGVSFADQFSQGHSPLVASAVLVVAVAMPRCPGVVVCAGAEDDLLHGLLRNVYRRENQEDRLGETQERRHSGGPACQRDCPSAE